MARNQETADARVTLKTFPTPLATDVLFYIMRDATLPRNSIPPYGTPFDDIQPRKESWPDHVLVFVSPADVNNQQRWYFAARRESQDNYNFVLDSGSQLFREYVIPRDLYYARVTPEVPEEFPALEAATPDSRFSQFGFADDTITDAGEILRSHFIIIKRRFIEPITKEIKFSDQLERDVLVTKEVIAPEVTPTKTPDVAGATVEIQHGNIFHDVRITQDLILQDGDSYPIELSTVPGYADFNFPNRLDAVNIVLAYAYAYSSTAVPAYQEQYYFEYKVVKPRPGPYEATIRRFLTDDPDAIRAAYPMYQMPSELRETIGIAYAWYHASTLGNRASAVATEQEVPQSVHDLITITLNGLDVNTTPSRQKLNTTTLPQTPGWAGYVTVTGPNSPGMVIGYKSQKTSFGLFLVEVTTIFPSNLYADYDTSSTTSTTGGASTLTAVVGASITLDASSIPSTSDPVYYSFQSTGFIYEPGASGTDDFFVVNPVTRTTSRSWVAASRQGIGRYDVTTGELVYDYDLLTFNLDIRPTVPVLTPGPNGGTSNIPLQVGSSLQVSAQIASDGSFEPYLATHQWYSDSNLTVEVETTTTDTGRVSYCIVPIDEVATFHRWLKVTNITGTVTSAEFIINVTGP